HRGAGAPWLLPAATGAALLVLGGGAALLFWPAAAPQAPAPPPVAAVSAIELIALATEADILAAHSSDLAVRRLAPNPAVLVLDFPTLAEQGRMLNRVAALVEKAGLPRDRVLDDAALAAAIRAGGTTPETFYYGHNYRASDLLRFFQLADRDGVRLNADEERLRGLLRDIGWLSLGAHGAVVSIPHAGVEPWLDMRARAAMLRHELSHGEFFTNPVFEATVWRFWREMLTESERTRFRAALAAESYDPTLEEVMANEAQAFLFNTPDERFFNPATIGMPPERVAALRAAFIAAMPSGWLRDAMAR
uniref:hypothetical protein n=1 Tax=Falsiroseomonas oryziterrae TaxID=2911368 RepID=UPI001F32CAA8